MRALDLTYPLLCLPRELGPCVAADSETLERCREVVYRRGRFYEGLRLVDPEGRTFAVTRATIRKPASGLGQRLARLLDLMLTIEVEADPADRLPLAEIVETIERAIDEDAESFEEFSGRSVDWWREEMAKARSVRDLIRAFHPATGP